MTPITSLPAYLQAVSALPHVRDAYTLFEEACTDGVRAEIYGLADADSPEPFRSAMYALGYTAY